MKSTEQCWICGKQKGQPPDRCPGHYEMEGSGHECAATLKQPDPIHNAGESMWQLVIRDMEARESFGKAEYGTVLQINDGRDHLVDAYQEALDLAVYLKQEIEQRRHDVRAAIESWKPK